VTRPPLREAHAHLFSLGESLQMTDLAPCSSVRECLDHVARAASRAPFARLHGARVEAWSDARWPTLAELDRAAPTTPVVILSFDHHAAVANSAALHAAGLTTGTPVPPNGVVCADPATGAPTGLLIEHAAFRAWDAAPEPDAPARRAAIAAALAHLASLGFDEVHDLHSQPWLGPILADMDRAGQLASLGFRELWLYPNVTDADHAVATRARWESPRLRLAGFKIFLDGTLNSRTAWMLEPYRDPVPAHPRGQCMLPLPELDAAMATAQRHGVGLAVHAIGDAAVRATLDAWEARHKGTEAQRHGVPASASGVVPSCLCASVPSLRIEHCELIDPADVPRFAQLGVVCSVQPCHLLTDVEALTRYLPHRLDRVLPLADLIAAGCSPDNGLLWFGSDVPIVRADPHDSIQAATARRRLGAPESEAIAWNQRITEAQAWRAFAPAQQSLHA
jgi:hypothetical protein